MIDDHTFIFIYTDNNNNMLVIILVVIEGAAPLVIMNPGRSFSSGDGKPAGEQKRMDGYDPCSAVVSVSSSRFDADP